MDTLDSIFNEVTAAGNTANNTEIARIDEALANAYIDVETIKDDARTKVNALPYRNATQSQFIEARITDAESGVDPEILRRKGIIVKVATTGNITLSGLQTIDGFSVLANHRVLVKNQTNNKVNGLYLANSGAWVRAIDADTVTELKGIVVYVEKGTTNANTGWTANTTISILGTSAITFTRTSAKGVLLTSAVSYTVNTLANAYASATEIITRSEANYPLALADLDLQMSNYSATLLSYYNTKSSELDLAYIQADIEAENEACIAFNAVCEGIDPYTPPTP